MVGDFNAWNPALGKMKALKDGSFSFNINLERDSNYRFRYLADNTRWFDEPEADGQEVGAFGSPNNLIFT